MHSSTSLAVGERARSFKAIFPGLLSPLGIIFALFVAFTASQVWTDSEKAKAEIDREASALRSVIILATAFLAYLLCESDPKWRWLGRY